MKRKVIIRHTIGGTTTTRIWDTVRENLDPGQQMTQARYMDTARELRSIYEQAAEELYAKQQSFLHAHEERVRKYQAQLKAGEITQADYEAWMRGQVFQEKAWAQKREQIARTMVDIDKRAQDIVNTGRLDVFADNANYIGYSLETGAGANLGFGLYDSDAVMRLVKDKPDLLPLPEVDAGKDYAWYNKIINNSITQGIIQGEDLEEIVFRIATQTGETALAGMRRNARTAFTGAQNAGRVEGMRQAKDRGIDVKKRWMSFLDSRVRDTHADVDGQVADVDDPFLLSDGDMLMFPGDPAGKPRNVYNCRCTLVYVYPKYPSGIDRVDEDGEVVKDMTYREWERMKGGKGGHG